MQTTSTTEWLEPVAGWLPAGIIFPAGGMADAVAWLSVLLLAVCAFLLWRARGDEADVPSWEGPAPTEDDAVFELDLQTGRLSWSSTQALERLGYDHLESFDIDVSGDLIHPEDQHVLSEGRGQLASGNSVDAQIRVRSPQGSWSWFHLLASPERNRDGVFDRAVGVLRCTDDLHRLQEESAELRRLETVGTIAGGMAHEFNNYLTPVRGFIELAIDDLGPDHASVDGLQTALERVIHCSELVAQIQAYGRKSLLDLRPVDPMKLLPGIVRIGMSIDQTRDVAVRVEDDWPEQLPRVRLDKSQFQQAVIQLMRNAYEAMPRGGTLCVEAREVDVAEADCARSRDARPGPHVRLTVSDTGVGIAKDHMDQVMDPFFTTHGRAYARGMGLSMVQGMVAQHGGWMTIKSSRGRGTSVSLYFPVHTAPETVLQPPAETTVTAPVARMGRLLVADDEHFVRDVIKSVLEGEGWTVEEVGDSTGLMERFGGDAPDYDIVLLDVCMPGPPVEEAVGKIHASSPDTRILLTSGFSRNPRIDRLLRHRGVEFLSKPFSTQELLQKVDTLLPAVEAGAPGPCVTPTSQ